MVVGCQSGTRTTFGPWFSTYLVRQTGTRRGVRPLKKGLTGEKCSLTTQLFECTTST